MTLFVEILVTFLLVSSGVFGLVGSWGLIKLPDPMRRLHAPTKATTLGVGGVLIASMIASATFGMGVTWHELMITLFLFLTAPITAHFLAKAFLHRNATPSELPRTSTGEPWAGFGTTDDIDEKRQA